MLTVLGHSQRACSGFSRREVLQAGTGLLGVSLANVLAAEAATAPVRPRAKAAPQCNAQGGRGHWSYTFPAVVAGGGVRGGVVYGKTDKQAGYPTDRPISPADLSATVFHALGIDPDLRIMDPQGRPVPLTDNGRPLAEIFG